MPNPQTGHVGFSVKGKKYTWVFSVGAMCALEDHLGRGIIDITGELQSWLPPYEMVNGRAVAKLETADEIKARNARIRIGFCRSLFWSGLQDHHPDVTVQEAGDLMKDFGGMIPALGIITRGVALAQADAVADEASEAAHPRQRAKKTVSKPDQK